MHLIFWRNKTILQDYFTSDTKVVFDWRFRKNCGLEKFQKILKNNTYSVQNFGVRPT